MMVMTAKVNLKKVMIALAAVAALIVALILLLGGGGDSAETSAPTASSNDGRVKFLTDLGWDVTTSPTDSSQVRIPAASSDVFERYNALLAFLTAITVVLGMRVMGAMLISSLIVFPGLTAMRVFKSFRKVLLCALAVSVVCFFAGLCTSFALSVPTGASVVVANVAAFLLFSLIGKLRKTY